MAEPVRPRRFAISAGVVVALYVVAMFLVRPVPDALVTLLGGPKGGVDRIGGLRVTYRPPAGGPRLLEYPGLTGEMAGEVVDVLTHGGLVMREVIEDGSMRIPGIDELDPRDHDPDAVGVDIDQWRPEDGGGLHVDTFVHGPSPEAIERSLRNATSAGWSIPAGTSIAYERVEPYESGRPPYWRTYVLADAVAIDGSMIASALGSYDPNTNRPIVLLEFTPEGGKRFCDVTGRLSGKKLATLLGGRVRSAPIINGPICGGRASITMGGVDPVSGERERDALVAVLSQAGVPGGGAVESQEIIAPANVRVQEWLGRLILGLLGGAVFGGLVFLVLRFARPSWRTAPPRAAGTFPWRRLLVTLLAPLALILGADLTLPGINEIELEHVMRGASTTQLSAIAIGIMPIITSFILVEIVALAVPSLRWRRHDPRGRVGLGKAVAVTSLVVTLVQAYFVATYLESLDPFRDGLLVMSGWKLRLAVMASLGAGTMLLAVVAGLIREHGLGNGYGVLVLSGVVLALVHPYVQWGVVHLPDALEALVTRDILLGFATLAIVVAMTACVLRWQIASHDREPALRVPTSGLSPLVNTAAILSLIVLLSSIGLQSELERAMIWVTNLRARAWLSATIVIASVPVWCWLFARPSLIARVALPAGLEVPSRTTWLRGMAISVVVVLVAFAASTRAIVTDVATAMIGTAVVLDIIADARAHRQKLAPAAVLHQIQHAGVVERVLADAGIPCHIHASHLRTLLAFFGPFAPAIVLVPEALAADARLKIEEALRTPGAAILSPARSI